MGKEPERIAQIMGKWLGGGVESIVMNYYRHINRKNIQFDFLVDSDSTEIPYEEIKKLGGRVILIPPYQKLFDYQRALAKILKENNYKIIHSHINTLSVFPLKAAKKVGVPIRIAHSHSTSSAKEWKRNLIKTILKRFSKIYPTHYLCCSECAGRYQFGNKAYNKGKVLLINNAIDVEKFKFNEEERKEVRKELEIDNDTLIIGHIGRFVSVKNHDFLIDIFNEIHSKNNNSILLLAGQGPLMEEIKKKVKSLKLTDCVRFLGQRNDVNRLYQVFDIFLLPSLYEGLPVVGVEAQASGLLCILSDEVSKETKLIKTTTYIPLDKTALEWANIIINSYKKFKRKNTTKEISRNGFNIKKEAKNLEKLYLNSINN